MKLPRLDDLVNEQKDIYHHRDDENMFVVGPPGSGKTTLAILRAKYLSDLGCSVLVVTRNRMLAALAAELGNNVITTKTMHLFISEDHYQCIRKFAPNPIRYEYIWEEIIESYTHAEITPRLDHLIIDEAQNLPAGFFHWAVRFAARVITVFADEDQTTDPLRSSIADICSANLPLPYRLQKNHRNTNEVALVAEHFHHGNSKLPPGIVQRERGGEIPRIVKIRNWDELVSQIIIRYKNRGESIGLIVHTIEEVDYLYGLFERRLNDKDRVDFYTKNCPTAIAGKQLLEPGITIITGESAIGLEFDIVYLQDISRSLPSINVDDCRRMYMLCARAKNALILVDGPVALTQEQIASLPDSRVLQR